MIFDILTIFPDFFRSPLREGVLHRGIEAGLISVNPVNLRDFTSDRHRTTDDRPFGGGEGMVMKPEPILRALESLQISPSDAKVILMSPRGRVFDQSIAQELAEQGRLVIICGRYEGIDQRISDHCVDMELSIGDYILSGGEVAALVVMEAVCRLVPGVLGCGDSARNDSFSNGILEHPHYTRPRSFRGWEVPQVLLSGDHAAIAKWRRREALRVTMCRRPDLLERARLDPEDLKLLDELREEKH